MSLTVANDYSNEGSIKLSRTLGTAAVPLEVFLVAQLIILKSLICEALPHDVMS